MRVLPIWYNRGMKRPYPLLLAALAAFSASANVAPSEAKCDAWLKDLYRALPFTEYTIVDRAARALEGNTGGDRANLGYPWRPIRAARPSSCSFAGAWNWDCAFMALAMSKWDVELARDQFRLFAKLQRADGMYPDCWKLGDEGVFAGCSKPPVLAWAVWACERESHDAEFLAQAYESLKRNVGWWHAKRGGEKDVLLHYDGEAQDAKTRQLYAGWESGMDDSPRWDGKPWQLWPVDLNCYMAMTYRAMRDFARRLGKAEDERLWIDRERRLTQAIEERLWDAEAQRYCDWDFVEKRFSRVLTPAAFLPLFIGSASDERAAAMAKAAERLSPGWPTVAYDEPTYDPVGYWRGRTWLNVAYFALRGLKWYGHDAIAERGKAELMKWMLREPSNFNENYNSKTGQAVGAMYFGWSNAFAIKMVLDWQKPRAVEMPSATPDGKTWMNAALRPEVRAEALLAAMNREEKIGQITQLVPMEPKEYESAYASARAGTVGSYIWINHDIARHNRHQRAAVEESRLGIPILFGMDVIHGHDLTFPISPALAGAFEPALFEKVQAFAAREARAEGVDWAFAPMCDIARDPRWGRVAETCGEDPYLAALCCAAQVRGFQGADPSAPDRVAACLKHYVAYGASIGGRDYNDTSFCEWELRNVHLPSFRAAIAAGALTVMSSFNAIDGVPASAARHTLDDILRGEWGFRGFVVCDWEAVLQMPAWGVSRDRCESSWMCLNAGNDMDMKSDWFRPELPKALASGRVKEETLDIAVTRVLETKFKVGLFERPYADQARYDALTNEANRADARAFARECVRRSAVLVKNEGVLPLDPAAVRKVAVIGPFADNPNEMIGCWRCRGRKETAVSLLRGLKAALPSAEVVALEGCKVSTAKPTKTLQDGSVVEDRDAKPADTSLDVAGAQKLARGADVVVMALGEPYGWTGENASRASLGLTGRQDDLFAAVAACGKPIVTVLFSGRPLTVPQVWEKSTAVFYAWQPGSEAGNGLADLIVGKASPSARLVMSVAHDVGQLPCYYNHAVTGRPQYSPFYRDTPESGSRYPFGFGLTYTRFAYGEPVLSVRDGKPFVSATVKNVGSRAGTETAQLYVHAKSCSEGWRPVRELRGFRRLALEPGETGTAEFEITDGTLAFTDREGNLKVEPGDYELFVSASSAVGKPVVFTRK